MFSAIDTVDKSDGQRRRDRQTDGKNEVVAYIVSRGN